jgi:N-acyl homoserine lactone hydrolase
MQHRWLARPGELRVGCRTGELPSGGVALGGSSPLRASSRRTGATFSRRPPELWEDGRVPSPPTIAPVLVADLLAEGERMPVYVHVIDHPDARVLVDTGMTELHPEVADLDPRLLPLSEQDFDLAGIDVVVNTHLHFDHCGGNHLFAGRPIYVQRRELEDARSENNYTVREWVDAPGVHYVPVDGELELLPGLRLIPAPGHTRGSQVVVVETGGRPVVAGGDVAVWLGELNEPQTEGQLRVRALDPELVWLAHEHQPWRPRTV